MVQPQGRKEASLAKAFSQDSDTASVNGLKINVYDPVDPQVIKGSRPFYLLSCLLFVLHVRHIYLQSVNKELTLLCANH